MESANELHRKFKFFMWISHLSETIIIHYWQVKQKAIHMNPRDHFAVAICKPGDEVQWAMCPIIFQQCVYY